ncbi:hypothetical protein BGW36DRAFT_38755 [Talaromyces proteolyticus]|uniref:Uncharacterized protein n=1 Tax=Talaromyces proteolyticus TaxID=1131652 RepID=A0AAD4PU47_9EURO|nr:uncharacterized protein BGW36DRAFT_38755 [Talaromyces proteolyticus]KAH8691840.1 hypothetical protein BGW36DRAFT_38755 [Talaromyces proteolyticus]
MQSNGSIGSHGHDDLTRSWRIVQSQPVLMKAMMSLDEMMNAKDGEINRLKKDKEDLFVLVNKLGHWISTSLKPPDELAVQLRKYSTAAANLESPRRNHNDPSVAMAPFSEPAIFQPQAVAHFQTQSFQPEPFPSESFPSQSFPPGLTTTMGSDDYLYTGPPGDGRNGAQINVDSIDPPNYIRMALRSASKT